MVRRVGIEPTTGRLKVCGSTTELPAQKMVGAEGFEPTHPFG